MSDITYQGFDSLASARALLSLPPFDVKRGLTPQRIADSNIHATANLTLNWAASPASAEHLEAFQALSDEAQLVAKYRSLASGSIANTGEGRAVLHHLTRGNLLPDPVVIDGTDKGAFYSAVMAKVSKFASSVHSGAIVGSTGKPFTDVCQIGIGGSDLGPRALSRALSLTIPAKLCLRPHFVSNVDPADAISTVRSLDPETTLFILVSKSGTTLETLTNRHLIEEIVHSTLPASTTGYDFSRHIVAVTSQTSPLAGSQDVLDCFYIDDNIGGRYSSSSAVGTLIISLAFGSDVARQVLRGMHEADMNALSPTVADNASLFAALLGVYYRAALHKPNIAVLPYSQALELFPLHLQQLDMESNGKSVDRSGRRVPYLTGPTLFGSPCTNAQHSFFQHLHQSPDSTPIEFIAFAHYPTANLGPFGPAAPEGTNSAAPSEATTPAAPSGTTSADSATPVPLSPSLTRAICDSQKKLSANAIAQIVALAQGASDPNPNKSFSGGRYSTLLYAPLLTPATLGSLLAFYENKVMFQGFIWNLNSFDQEGVQLGKRLATRILSSASASSDPTSDTLAAYSKLLSL